MLQLHQTFVKDPKGKDIGVFLPMSDYQKIVELIEDYKKIVAFYKAIMHKDDVMPFRDALEELEDPSK